MSTNNNNQSSVLFTESPASWNTKYVSPDGFVCQFTIRADNGTKLLEKTQTAIEFLMENDCIPYYYGNGPRVQENKQDKGKSDQSNPNGNESGPAWCPIHKCEMKRRERDGQVWYSHKVNGAWCKGQE